MEGLKKINVVSNPAFEVPQGSEHGLTQPHHAGLLSMPSNMGDASVANSVCMGGDDYAFYRSWLREQKDKDPELAAQWVQWEAQGLISPKVSTKQMQAPWGQAVSTTGTAASSSSCSNVNSVNPTPHASNVGYLSSQLYQQAAAPKRAEPDLREPKAPRHMKAAAHHSGGDNAHSAAAAAAAAVTAADAAGVHIQMQAQQKHTSHWQAAAQSLRRSLDNSSIRRSLNMSRSPSNGSTSTAAAAATCSVSAVSSSKSSKSPTRRAEMSRKQLKAVRKLFPITTPSLKPAAVLQGEYQQLDIIGQGAFGCAYKARHLPTGGLVCIKTLEAPSGQDKDEQLARQKREIAVLAALALHPNIIRYHECYTDHGKLQLVMEWADGGDLDSLIQRHAKARTYMSEDTVLGYFVQLIAALGHVHAVGIMHRDIKSNNVFMTSQGLLKLGDFGISKVVDGAGTTSNSGSGGKATSTGTSSSGMSVYPSRGVWAHSFVGTPNYLAPEMVACEGYGFKADIWAAGCVLYEMAALKPAFRAKQISIIYHMIRRGKFSQLPSIYSKELQALQRRMMARDPAERPSCAEILQEEFLRPHVTRYHNLLRQLKLELPRSPYDYTYGSTSGSHTLAALLSGRNSAEGSPHSTRTSIEDWGWPAFAACSRLGRQKNTRDSLDSKVQLGHKLTSHAAEYLQQLAAAGALQIGAHWAEGPVSESLPLQQQEQQQQLIHLSASLLPHKKYMHQVSGSSTSSGSTPQALSGAPSTRVSQDLSRNVAEALLAIPEQAHKPAGPPAAAAFKRTGSSGDSRTTSASTSSSNSGAAASFVSGAAADVSCNGGVTSPDNACTPQANLTDPGTASAATGTRTADPSAFGPPTALHIDVIETPHNSACSAVTIEGECASDSSSTIHIVNSSSVNYNSSSSLARLQLPGKEILLQETAVLNDHGPLYTGCLQQHTSQLSACMHKGKFSRRKCIVSKLRRSCAALFGGTRRSSRLSGDASAAAGFGGKHDSSQQKQAFLISPASNSPDGSTDGVIPVGITRSSAEAEDASTYGKSWEDLLREAGVTAANAADAALLQKAGVLWEVASASSSQRSSLEQPRGTGSGDGQNRRSAEYQGLAKSGSTSSFHDDISVGGGRSTKSRAHSRKASVDMRQSGSTGSLVELGASLASSTTRRKSLGTWFKRRSQEAPNRGAAVASTAAGPAAATKPSAKQQTQQQKQKQEAKQQKQKQQQEAQQQRQKQQQEAQQQQLKAQQQQEHQQQQKQQQEAPSTSSVDAEECISHSALAIPVQSQGSMLLSQQLQQLRQLASAFGHVRGLLGDSLSTITECSEGSRMVSRRTSGLTSMLNSNSQSLRGSLDVGSPKSSPTGAGNQQHGFARLSPLAPLPEERLTPVTEASSADGSAAHVAAAVGFSQDTAAGADAGTTASREALLQQEQLLAALSVYKLKAMLSSPLDPAVQPGYHT